MGMRVVHARCAGVDVHKRRVVVCVITPKGRWTRTYGTTTGELTALAEWLTEQQVVDVAMESTGVYWKPLYNLLEALEMRPVVANARAIKAMPGRKTDVSDAAWIADLHRHGLVRPSFIPGRSQRELRELVRYRRAVIQERTREAARVQKVLEGANVKLASVASDVLGVSGRQMLRRIIVGEDDPQALAALARDCLRDKHDALVEALRGQVGEHQRLLPAAQLQHIEELEAREARLSARIEQRLAPSAADLEALDTIPGVGRRTAEDLVAEIGTDMSRFPSARHLASWAKICPGNHQSGGKRKSDRTGHGNKWLRATLTEAAKAAGRSKQTYLGAQYHRLARRLGGNKATFAVAHSILTIIYYLLRDGGTYHDLGPTYLDERARDLVRHSLVRRLQQLDFDVAISDQRAA